MVLSCDRVFGAPQSHILSVTYVAAICALTALLYCVRIVRDKRYVELLKAAGLTVLLNAWYLAPFLFYYYRENLNKEVLRWSGYFEQSINLSNMTQTLSLYNKQYFSLGLALLGGVGLGVFYLLCERKKSWGKRTAFCFTCWCLDRRLSLWLQAIFRAERLWQAPFSAILPRCRNFHGVFWDRRPPVSLLWERRLWSVQN